MYHYLLLLTSIIFCNLFSEDFQELRGKLNQPIEQASELKKLFYEGLIEGRCLSLLDERGPAGQEEVKFKQREDLLWQDVTNNQALHMNLLKEKVNYDFLEWKKIGLGRVALAGATVCGLIAVCQVLRLVSMSRHDRAIPRITAAGFGVGSLIFALIASGAYDASNTSSAGCERWQRLIADLNREGETVAFNDEKQAIIKQFFLDAYRYKMGLSREIRIPIINASCDEFFSKQ